MSRLDPCSVEPVELRCVVGPYLSLSLARFLLPGQAMGVAELKSTGEESEDAKGGVEKGTVLE